MSESQPEGLLMSYYVNMSRADLHLSVSGVLCDIGEANGRFCDSAAGYKGFAKDCTP